MTYDAPRAWSAGDLTCSAITRDDLPFFIALFRDPAMLSHRPDPTPDSPDTLSAALERDITHWDTQGFGRYVVRKGSARLGLCGLTLKDGYDGLNISYHIAPSEWRKGYASRLAEGLTAMARDLAPRPAQVYGLVRPANPASARVLAKLGFTLDGARSLGGAPTELWVLPIP